ncbi:MULTISPECIES: hypothetical protein [Listeria]|uniref:hypothetical protein n=1 Tax=Listeria TaxID=1637 RepID=UPI0011EB9314|nr:MULTISPECIES: hypothetical protein [Listeria]MBC2140163.1 hypothetical protein [Listeria innocua]TYV04653.1 hypothetical protein FZ054_09535 [Listeria monocytogenes]
MLEKDAIQFIQESTIKPEERLVKSDEQLFAINADGDVKEIKKRAIIADKRLYLNTLTGLIDYIKANLERIDKKMILRINGPQEVMLEGLLEFDGNRETLVHVDALLPEIRYNNFLDSESFIIALQANFTETPDRDILLKVMGNVVEGEVKNVGDDGTSQSVVIKSGISSKAEAKVPNPVVLAPYRTFIEVEQPASSFIFRMKEGPCGAIFEADGGAWKHAAIKNVKEHLAAALDEEIQAGRITLIA